MDKDSKEIILKHWSALCVHHRSMRPFRTFNELYRYLKSYTKEQGMPSKKDIYKHSMLPKIPSYSSAGKQVEAHSKKKLNEATTITLAFRQLVKGQKKVAEIVDFPASDLLN